MSGETPEAGNIIFGLSRKDDERSLAAFLRLVGDENLSSVLIPRLSDTEIEQLVDLFSTLMRKHLSKQEYHALFLREPDHNH